jgi:peptide methionine sulfoxide reductase msrA/msrB
LFGSEDKFDSGTGWPSFTKPLHEGLVRREADYRGGAVRTAIASRLGRTRLGYLLYDGPGPDKLHYLVNSASLRFVPASGQANAAALKGDHFKSNEQMFDKRL